MAGLGHSGAQAPGKGSARFPGFPEALRSRPRESPCFLSDPGACSGPLDLGGAESWPPDVARGKCQGGSWSWDGCGDGAGAGGEGWRGVGSDLHFVLLQVEPGRQVLAGPVARVLVVYEVFLEHV